MIDFVLGSGYWALVLTVAVFMLARVIRVKTKLAVLNPIPVAAAIIIAVLVICKLPNADYQAGMKSISWLLTPCTVCLGVPLYTQFNQLRGNMKELGMDSKFTARAVNEGFSGGEKKRNDILQMMMLQPSYAILDETDSGLDVDALRIVSEGVNAMRAPFRSFMVITHYKRLLDYIRPDVVHILYHGKIVRTGGFELVDYIEDHGFDFVKTEEA